MNIRLVQLFLRLAISASFLSACADRFGLWGKNSAWGNWDNFVAYTGTINPWLPQALVPAAAGIATGLEIVLPILLIAGYKTKQAALASGSLLILFALAMTFSTGIKGPLDYSVFSAAAAAFALAYLSEKHSS